MARMLDELTGICVLLPRNDVCPCLLMAVLCSLMVSLKSMLVYCVTFVKKIPVAMGEI